MVITNSPDISLLLVKATFDISGATPVIALENLSQGNALANVSYAFIAKSPTDTFIHNGDITNPDISGVWSTHNLTDAWPRPFNQIEWSGAPYSFQVIAQDSNGTIFTADVQTAMICRPTGNLPTSKNTFGIANANVTVKCEQARVFFEDITSHSYKGLEGTQISSTLKVIYPIDETGELPAPFSITDFTAVLVPISYSSDNYQFLQASVYDYDLGNYIHVKIKYQQIQTFAVWCNVDLEPLLCEIRKLIDDIQSGDCQDVVSANQKLSLINSKLSLVFIGILQPLTGVDVPTLIEEIKQIGGFNCNCCSAATGIIPTTTSSIDGYTFQVVHTGGDVNGDINAVGTLIQIRLHDVTYIVKVCDDAQPPSDAFSFTPSLSNDGFTKTYCLKVDGNKLAFEILNIINNNQTLINLLNVLIKNSFGNGNFNLIVDGKCIFQSTDSCDYCYVLSDIPADTTYAAVTSIKAGDTVHSIFYAFNMSNLDGLQEYLNGLGLGTFTVSCYNDIKVKICSSYNTHDLQNLYYKVGATNLLADYSRNCTGYLPVSANEVVQKIIDYICGLTDTEVVTSQDYAVCYIDPITKSKKTVTITAGTSINAVLVALSEKGCKTVDYILAGNGITCNALQNLFPANIKPLVNSDWVFASKGGACSRVLVTELAKTIFNISYYDIDLLNLFCKLIDACRGNGAVCDPYTTFQVSTVPYDNDCPVIQDFTFNQTQSSPGCNLELTKVIFANAPGSPQTVTVQYKLHSDSSWIILNAAQGVNTDGTFTPSNPVVPMDSTGVPYDVRLSDNCSSPADYVEKQFVCTSGGGTIYGGVAQISPFIVSGSMNKTGHDMVMQITIEGTGSDQNIGRAFDSDVWPVHNIGPTDGHVLDSSNNVIGNIQLTYTAGGYIAIIGSWTFNTGDQIYVTFTE